MVNRSSNLVASESIRNREKRKNKNELGFCPNVIFTELTCCGTEKGLFGVLGRGKK